MPRQPRPTKNRPLITVGADLDARCLSLLALIGEAKHDDEIAGRYRVTIHTVRAWIQRLKAETQLRSRVELAALAYAMKLVSPSRVVRHSIASRLAIQPPPPPATQQARRSTVAPPGPRPFSPARSH